MGASTPVGKVLRGSLMPHPIEQVDEALRSTQATNLGGLAHAASYHGIQGYVFEAIRDRPEVPEDERARLEQGRTNVLLTHLRTAGDLRYLQRTFDGAQVPWLVIKGPALAIPVHGRPELRAYGDLDIVVPGAHFGAAIAALTEHGSSILDRNWTLINARLKGEVHLRLPSGTTLDLHWHVFNEPDRRRRYPVSINRLFERSESVSISGREARTTSVADTMVYLALHTLHSGADRLIWVKDLERMCARTDLPVDDVADRAREWRAQLVLATALRQVDLTIGLPARARPLQSACGRHRTWLAVSSWAWRRAPVEEADGSGSLGRITSRSVGRTQGESLASLARNGMRHLREGKGTSVEERRRFPPDDPRSDRYESGGETVKSSYIDRVSRLGT